MTPATRVYLAGMGVALGYCTVAVAFPELPTPVMLGALGGTLLALASKAHRYAQAREKPQRNHRQRRDSSPDHRSGSPAVTVP